MNRKRIFTSLLALILVIASLALTSCYELGGELFPGADDRVTREELDELAEQLRGEIAPGDVNNYDIEISSGAESNVIAASKAALSVVSVYSSFKRTQGYGYTQQYSSVGSGVIYKLDKEKGDAYVITNYHVVYSEYSNTEDGISDDITLFLYGQEVIDYAIPATYVGGSMGYDLAVLKVSASDVLRKSNAIAASFADSNEVSLLETAIAIGNPESLGISATVGYISVDSEYITINMVLKTGQSNTVKLRVMRVDAAVNSGNSGGGLFNSSGELIGIVNAKIADTSVESIGYAIPSNIAKAIADNILYYSENADYPCVYRCLLGITVSASKSYTEYDTESGKVHRLEEVSIRELTDTSIAKGILEVGDQIKSITINGKKYEVTRMFCVIDSMLNARVGDTVEIEIVRNGATLTKAVIITEGTLTAVK